MSSSDSDSSDSDYFCYDLPLIHGKRIKPNSLVDKFILDIADHDFKAHFSWQKFFDSLSLPPRLSRKFLIQSLLDSSLSFIHLDNLSILSSHDLFALIGCLPHIPMDLDTQPKKYTKSTKSTLQARVLELEALVASLSVN